MAVKKIKHKPLTHKQYEKVHNISPLTDLMLQTGARITEIKRIIDCYHHGIVDDYVDIKTKKSGEHTNRIYLTKYALESLSKTKKYFNKSVRTISRRVKDISEQTGILFSSHNLRATFGTRLLEMGVDLVTVSTLMNHSDISITAQYIAFTETKLRQGLNLLEEYNTLGGFTHAELLEELYKKDIKIDLLEKEIVRLRKRING